VAVPVFGVGRVLLEAELVVVELALLEAELAGVGYLGGEAVFLVGGLVEDVLERALLLVDVFVEVDEFGCLGEVVVGILDAFLEYVFHGVARVSAEFGEECLLELDGKVPLPEHVVELHFLG